MIGGQTRRLLLLGFGGLLLLLGISGLYALSVLGNIERENARIREDFVNRDRILEQLRSDIYLSGTYARDFLLESDPLRAQLQRRAFEASRVRVESMLDAYGRVLRPEERHAFDNFSRQVRTYFSFLEPALSWNAEQRNTLGREFMAVGLLPKRETVVQVADQIRDVNQRQLETGARQVSALFAHFRQSVLLLFIATLIGGLLVTAASIRGVLKLEREANMRFEETVQARRALSELSARLLEVQESERRALSRELHDEVGQSLTALLIGIDNVSATLPLSAQSDARDHLKQMRRVAERTVAVVRDMSLLLRPSMLDDLGLVPALQWQAREMSRTRNIDVQVDADSVSDELTDEQKTCIYRVVQEALHNAVRHANAKKVQVQLSQNNGHLALTITDDGKGFSPEREKGIGLLGMEERVRHLSGSLALRSRPGQGTQVRVELPREARDA